MILIIGGAASGKRTYAKSLGYREEDMADAAQDGQSVLAVLGSYPVLYNLQDLVSLAPERADELLPELLKKDVVICNEVGSGVIPAVPRERAAREASGRLCVLLAQRADRVVRMVSGIPVVIKDVAQ